MGRIRSNNCFSTRSFRCKTTLFTERNGSIIFGSEIKALLAHPSVPAEIDADGINEIFGLGLFRTPGCGVFKHIQEVRAGHSIKFTRHKK